MESHATSSSERLSGWRWWLAAIVAAAAFGFGAVGLWQYESSLDHGHPDPLSILYHTLQLFILHAPHLEHETPWALHAGRLLGAVLFFAFLRELTRDQLLLLRFWFPWRRGHVVVCGLGDLGLRLALDARRQGRFVVAIETHPAPDALAKARVRGVLVLEGDARDPAQLRRARIARADYLLATCKNDQTNVAVAALVGQFSQPTKRHPGPLVCRLLIRDSTLRPVVSNEALFPHTGSSYSVNFTDLDLEDTAARQAIRRNPLDFMPIHKDDDIQAHLVVIGFGQMGQSLTLQAARIGHFASEVGKRARKLRITVMDKDDIAWRNFILRYEKFEEVCDAKFVPGNPHDAGFAEAMATGRLEADGHNALVTYACCIKENDDTDDQSNLRLGLKLSELTAHGPAQVLIHQSSSRGFAALFPKEGRGPGLSDRVYAFGMKEDVFTWDILLHESEDKLARAVHECYQSSSGQNAVHQDWDGLPEAFKESNRQAADHISIKLRALGYVDSTVREGKETIQSFDEKEMELLAKLEHVRWCAERFLAGWKYGKPTVRELKINECLVPWDELEAKDKKKDWNQIEAIPQILFSVGRGIYRLEGRTKPNTGA